MCNARVTLVKKATAAGDSGELGVVFCLIVKVRVQSMVNRGWSGVWALHDVERSDCLLLERQNISLFSRFSFFGTADIAGATRDCGLDSSAVALDLPLNELPTS